MSNPTTPVKGYTPQSDERLALVNHNKEMEERALRRIAELGRMNTGMNPTCDHDCLAMARAQLIQAFMWMNRAVMQPQRISLPEDNQTDGGQ